MDGNVLGSTTLNERKTKQIEQHTQVELGRNEIRWDTVESSISVINCDNDIANDNTIAIEQLKSFSLRIQVRSRSCCRSKLGDVHNAHTQTGTSSSRSSLNVVATIVTSNTEVAHAVSAILLHSLSGSFWTRTWHLVRHSNIVLWWRCSITNVYLIRLFNLWLFPFHLCCVCLFVS